MIDDEESVRAALRASIEALEGFDVQLAPDGETGLDLIAGNKFNLLLVDLVMPVVDGFEVLRRLRSMSADDRPRRVIVVSAMVDPALQDSVRELGGHGVLAKPFRLDELRRLLDDVPR